MKLGSLFSGSGGFELAGLVSGIVPVWASEIEPYPIKVTSLRLPEMKHLGNILGINGAEIEPVDVITFGSPCFPAGTLINTASGYKPIEDITVTDRVLSHTGEWRQVLCSQYTGTKSLMRLKAMGIHHIDATPDHLFYVMRNGKAQWVALKDMQRGDRVCAPIVKACDNPMNLTHEECWLIGRFIADGYTRSEQRPDRPIGSTYSTVVYCIGNEKEDDFESHIGQLKYGKSEKTRNATKYTISSHRLLQLCEACGKGAGNKSMPPFLLNLPTDLLKSVLDGYLSGDGCKIKNYFQCTTISEQLALSLAQAIAKVYHKPFRMYKTDVPETKVIEGRIVKQQPFWIIRYKSGEASRDQAYCDGCNVWLPVRSVEELPDKKPVYDITVAIDHSFCVCNIAVHNCQDLSVAGKQAGIHDGQRSNLFFEAVRVIKEMRDATNGKHPRFAVWENVPGAFSSNKGADFLAVLQALCEVKEPGVHVPGPARERAKWLPAGCIVGDGYSVAWRVYDAQYWGVPQRRKRIYLVADFGSERAGEILFKSESVSGHSAESGKARESAAADAEGSSGGSCFSLQGHVIDRESGQNGRGWTEGAAYTLDATDRNAVVYPEGSIGTICARADSGPCIDRGQPFICYAPNGTNCSDYEEAAVSATLHTKYHYGSGGDAALVFENHSQDSRYTGPVDVSQTVSATFGTGGNNTPIVVTEESHE